MKNTFRAVLSVFCAVTLLASLIIPSLVLPASAYTIPENQDSITFTFDETDFKANTKLNNIQVSGAQYAVTGGALKISGDKVQYNGSLCSMIFNNGSDILKLDPGTYAVNFKYRYDYSKHTNNLYCANYNNYKSNAQYFNFTVNTPEGTSVPQDVGTTVVKDFITTSEDVDGSTQKEKTVLVNITGSSAVNFGIRSVYLECDVYIDEIIIAKKTSIKIIVTDGTDGAHVDPLSGIPGDVATLPGAEELDGAIAGKFFERYYAALATPITAAMTFPTDALTKTIYAKMVTDNAVPDSTVTIDFEENTEAGTTGLVSIVSDGTNKVLSIRGNNATQVRSKGIKDKDGNEYTLKAGVWEVTYKYKIPETYSAATRVYIIHGFDEYKGELCDADPSQNYTSGRKLFDNNLVVNSTVSTWHKVYNRYKPF